MQNVTGHFEVIEDNQGSPYFAFKVDKKSILSYVDFLAEKIDPSFIETQQKRDSGTYHVTILNSMHYGSMKKRNPDALEPLISKLSQQSPSFTIHGIGTVYGFKKQSKAEIEECVPQQETQAFFLVLSHETIDAIRKEAFPDWNFPSLHCTIAIKIQDIHGPDVDKGINSLIYPEIKNPQNNQGIFKIK